MRLPGSYRYVTRPKWLAGHLLAIVAIVGFVLLGFWQLRRHDERSNVNAVILQRSEARPVGLAELLAVYGEDPDALEYRRVRIAGTYLPDDEVLWQARTLRGSSGHDVLTPLAHANRAVVVNRGWVPIDVVGPPVRGAEPESTTVEVTGVIRRGQQPGGLGPTDPASGPLERISRVDLDRLQRQIDLDLYPFYLLLESQIPAQGSLPVLRPGSATDAGPHLGYAMQWFLFAGVTALSYPLLLRKTAREQVSPSRGEAQPPRVSR